MIALAQTPLGCWVGIYWEDFVERGEDGENSPRARGAIFVNLSFPKRLIANEGAEMTLTVVAPLDSKSFKCSERLCFVGWT